MSTYGIKETRELIQFAVSMVEAGRVSLGDGEFNFPGDLVNFVDPVTKMPAAFSGITNVPNELFDLDDEEIDELRNEFGEIIDDPRWIKVIHASFLLFDSVVELVNDEKAEETDLA